MGDYLRQQYYNRLENQHRKEELKKGLEYYYENTNINNLEKETNND